MFPAPIILYNFLHCFYQQILRPISLTRVPLKDTLKEYFSNCNFPADGWSSTAMLPQKIARMMTLTIIEIMGQYTLGSGRGAKRKSRDVGDHIPTNPSHRFSIM